MELGRFREIVDAYGTDPRRWPEDEREKAVAFATSSQEARSLKAEAEKLDGLLSQAAEPISQPTLLDTVMGLSNEAQDRPQGSPVLPFGLNPSFLLPRLTSLAAAAILGFFVGGSVVDNTHYANAGSKDGEVDISMLIYGTDIEESWQ